VVSIQQPEHLVVPGGLRTDVPTQQCELPDDDIWRSFVAQRCLWAMGRELVFTGPEVFQDRNQHNLLRDLEQEIPGYLGNERIRKLLEDLELASGPAGASRNLMRCYEALAAAGFIPAIEIDLVRAWLTDFENAALGGVRANV
jgi:hypothetical protein